MAVRVAFADNMRLGNGWVRVRLHEVLHGARHFGSVSQRRVNLFAGDFHVDGIHRRRWCGIIKWGNTCYSCNIFMASTIFCRKAA